MKVLEVHDAVVLTEDLPEHGLKRGSLGAVLECFSGPDTAYEVEFADEDGRTLAQLTLRPGQVAKYEPGRAGNPAAA